jgi:acetyl/propionyl-CoA carboxylase alpha subunit
MDQESIFSGLFLAQINYLCVPMDERNYKNFIANCGESKITISEKELSKLLITQVSPELIQINYKNKNYEFRIESIAMDKNEVELKHLKRKLTIRIEDHLQQIIQSLGYNSLKSKHTDSLLAPMPGLVIEVVAKAGDEVKKGDHLISLEAMKMENILKAAHDGIIKEVKVKKSDKVEKNQVLLLFEDTK